MRRSLMRCNDFFVLLFFSTFLIPQLTIAHPKLDVQYFGEAIHGNIIDRFISINGTNITISGFTYNINATWDSLNATKMSFPSIWVERALGRYRNNLLPVRDDIVDELLSRGRALIFAADYNGTHYKEVIIEGKATAVWGIPLDAVNRSIPSISYSAYRVIYEEKRTEIASENASSKYNPSLAILNAIRFLNNKSLVFDNVTKVFLIPQEYLTDEYKNYEFVWSMIFLHDLNSSEGADLELNHFILSPNATIIRHIHLILRIVEGVSPCHGCEPPKQYDYSLYFYASIGGIMVATLLVVVYVRITREKHKH